MRKIDLFIISLIILVFVLLVYDIQLARSEGSECRQNPLVYGAKKLSLLNNAEFIGSGAFSKAYSPIVHFNSYNLTVEFPGLPTQENQVLDLSGFNVSWVR